MTRRSGLALVIGLISLGLAGWASLSWADSAPTLRYDPFREPANLDRAGGANGSPGDVRQSFEPMLRSTILGGERALVNFGGEILMLGEETHGYRLIAVGLFEAIFVKDGQRIRLEVMKPEEAKR